MTEYEVILRRRNGRFVKMTKRPSKYAAKQLRKSWEEQHDHTFYVEIRKAGEEVSES